ncbi:CHAT domain-containing protein [Streptomyces sp. GbtcB7]|uniref:CHAT domain-containing tetratricopeptide repeat protein n=1 Tax=Streptomyces sp. GbtcB7 TaxID=2824752 RepID=UPI001C2FA775|nr:CHAT domain-containing protein [Streptomyces sp. GbtcB7]
MAQGTDGFGEQARALNRELETARVQGRHDPLMRLLQQGLDLAKARLEDGDRAAFAWYGHFAFRLWSAHQQLGYDPPLPAAREWWGFARRYGSAIGMLNASAMLLAAHMRTGDSTAAMHHATALPKALDQVSAAPPETGHGAQLDPLHPDYVLDLLTHAVVWLYYEEEQYKGCIEVSRALLPLSPDNATAAALLALSLAREKEHEAATEVFPLAIHLNPQWPGLHHNQALCLIELGRFQEALDSENKAIELVPANLLYRFTRGQLHQVMGDHTAAIADFDHVLEAVDSSSEQLAVSPRPTTPARYERDMPPRDLADFAALKRLLSLKETGAVDRLLADGRAILPSADPPTTQAVHRILGDALRELGGVQEAADEYGKAVAAGDDKDQTRLTLCDILVEAGRIDEAVAHLDRLADLADRQHSPWRAREMLQRIVERFPDHIGALRALGHAQCESGAPARSVATLTQVLDRVPGDAWALLWRGIALVTRSDEEDTAEEGVNDQFTLARVWDALTDLAQAALLPGEHRERAQQSLGWLLERAMWIPLARDTLLDNTFGDPETARLVLAACPGLEAPFEDIRESYLKMGPARRWGDGIARLRRVRGQLDGLRLPLLEAFTDALQADYLIRLYRVQEALDLLTEVERQAPLIGLSPFQTDDVRLERIADEDGKEGRWSGSLPLEHLQLGTAALAGLLDMVHSLRADADARLGNTAEALEKTPSFQHNDPAQAINSQFRKATFLRDAGRTDEALELLDSLPDLPTPTRPWARQTNLKVTTLLRAERLSEAETVARAALAQLPEAFGYERSVIRVNLASILIRRNEPAEALELMQATQLTEDVAPGQRQQWHTVLGQALAATGDHAAALVEFRTALALVETIRKSLRTLEARIPWQGQHLDLYEEALLSALGVGDAGAVFALLEQSKARAFVDQLESGRVTVDDQSERQRKHLDRARARTTVLRRLTSAADPVAEVELLRAYADLDGRFSDGRTAGAGREREAAVTTDAIARALEESEAAVLRLERRYEDAVVVTHEAATGRVLRLEEVVGHLRRLGGERVLLVEYLVIRGAVAVLFLRSDNHFLGGEVAEITVPELRELTDALTVEPSAGAARPVAADVLKRLSPLVEPILRYARPEDILLLVPHSILHGIPLHAIPVDGVPLLRRHPSCYTPSASVLQRCGEARERRGAARKGHDRWSSALVLGDSRGDLPHSRYEAATVAQTFGAQAVVGTEAKLSVLRERLAEGAGPDVLHLACHGLFDSDRALSSGIMLAPEAGQPAEEAVLTAEEIMRMSVDADLVVLSACSSGRSERRPGDELIGLARALLQAGAPTVLVSLWPVDDLSTSLLMEGFYRRAARRRQGTAALADALQQAQLDVADVTAEAVVAYCDARLATATGTEELLLRLDRADAQVLAGDLGAAVATYRMLIEQATGSASSAAQRIVAKAARALPLLELRSHLASPVDYTVRPFSDPYHWAPFILVGDCR